MAILLLVVTFVISLFKSQRQLVLENLALRQQVVMLRQSVKRPRASVADRLFWILFSRYVDGWRKILYALHPDTVVRWHRQGFRLYWRWKSQGPKPGRPPINAALRKLIREMQATNIGWGAPRIHGELLKLGIEVSQATVSKYMLLPKNHLHKRGALFSATMQSVWPRWISLPSPLPDFECFMCLLCLAMTAGELYTST